MDERLAAWIDVKCG